MRHAPPACIVAVDQGGWRGAQCLAMAATVAALSTWGVLRFGLGWAVPSIASLLAFSLIGLWWRSGVVSRELRWDGALWSLDRAVGRPRLMIDLGNWMLVRFQAAASRQLAWLAVGCGSDPAAWHAFRVAMHARATGLPGRESVATDAANPRAV